MRVHLALSLLALTFTFRSQVSPQEPEEEEIDLMVVALKDRPTVTIEDPVFVTLTEMRGAAHGRGRARWPTDWRVVTSPFAMRNGILHAGIDIDGDNTTLTYSVYAGVVIHAGPYYGYGKLVIIDHQNGLVTRYGHHKELFVRKGERVNMGQALGVVGATGHVISSGSNDGSHLHFEVILNGVHKNPMDYLN